VKWSLVALGVYLVLGLARIEFSERRVGLGHGFVAVLIVGTIRGVMLATARQRGGKRDADAF
jgi:hypothetical protein